MSKEVVLETLTEANTVLLPRMAYEAGYAGSRQRVPFEVAIQENTIGFMCDNWGAVGDHGLAAKVDGRTQGMAWSRSLQSVGHPWKAMAPEAPEVFIAVDEDERGRGIGGILLTHLEHDLAAQGHSVAFLHVYKSNQTAIRLYERCGFTIEHERTTKSGQVYYMMIALLKNSGILGVSVEADSPTAELRQAGDDRR